MFKNLLNFVFIFVPMFAYAQVTDIFEAQTLVYDIILKVSDLFWAIAVAFFIWGVVKFIKNANDTAEHEKGKQFMIWGIIAFLVLVSIWGLANLILVDTLGITPTGTPDFVDKNGATL